MLNYDFKKFCAFRSSSFNELTEDELNLLAKNTKETIYNKGESIIKQGTKSSQIILIKKGLIKITFKKNNQELVLSLESRGRLLGLQTLFTTDVYPYSAYCCEEVDAYLIDIDTVKSIIIGNTVFGTSLIKYINEYTFFIYNRMSCLSLNQVEGRFAHLLLYLSLSIYKKKIFTTPLSKKDMAHVTNMTQESLSRVIREFVVNKIIEFEGNRISILDYKKIKHISVVS